MTCAINNCHFTYDISNISEAYTDMMQATRDPLVDPEK